MDIGQSLQTSPNSQAPLANKGAISSDFDTFLRMLTAQMKNQDPLNPVDSADFATQLATFSNVEQAVITNDLLRDLSSRMGMAGLADMAPWVGQEARAAAPAYFDGTPITLFANPLPAAQSGEIVVRDASGFEVQRVPVPATTDALLWTGTGPGGVQMAQGVYDFTFVSLVDGQPAGATPVEIYSKVMEIRSVQGQTELVMRGGIAVRADAVTALRAAS